MKNILLLIMLCTSIFVACSDDDDKDDGNGNEKGWVVTMNRIINDKFEEDKEAYLICAGSGKMEIDWGDGTISKDLELPLYEEYDENFDADEDLDGSEFEHTYAQKGSYTITIKGEGKLTYLDLDCDTIKSLDVSKCPTLIYLSCNENKLKSLDVSKCTELVELVCYESELTSLNIIGCTKLRYLNCDANNFDRNEMNAIYNGLPDRTGKEAGIIEAYHEQGDKTIAEKKNWKVY